VGTPFNLHRPASPGTNLSLMAVIGIDGLKYSWWKDGPFVGRDLVELFIPIPRAELQGKHLVLDNASIHKGENVWIFLFSRRSLCVSSS
jgi:hypothetical protein